MLYFKVILTKRRESRPEHRGLRTYRNGARNVLQRLLCEIAFGPLVILLGPERVCSGKHFDMLYFTMKLSRQQESRTERNLSD